MTGSVSLREAALAAIAAHLAAQIPAAVVERARRAEVDTDNEALPRLILVGTDWKADEEQEPYRTHYTLGFEVTGYAAAADEADRAPGETADLSAERALSTLHAQVVDALAGWDAGVDGVGQVGETDAEFSLFAADASARSAGLFVARFTVLAVGPTGGPWST